MYPYSQTDHDTQPADYEATAHDTPEEHSTRPFFLDQLDAVISGSRHDAHKKHDHDHRHDNDHRYDHRHDNDHHAPKGQPPANRPHNRPSVKAVDAEAIRGCLYSQTYLYLKNGNSFWIFPTHVGYQSLSGYRWTRRKGWVYFGIDLSQIQSFSCGRF